MATELLKSMFASSTSEDYLLTDDGSCSESSELVESSSDDEDSYERMETVDEDSYAMMETVAEQSLVVEDEDSFAMMKPVEEQSLLGLGLVPENTISVSSNTYKGDGSACGLEEIEVVDALVTHEDGGTVLSTDNPEYLAQIGNYGPGSLLDNDEEEGGESMLPDTVAENTSLEVSYQKHAWPCDPTASAYSPTQSDVVTSATSTAMLYKSSPRSFATGVEEPPKPLHPNTTERGTDDSNGMHACFISSTSSDSFVSPSRSFETTSTAISMPAEIVPWPGTEGEEDYSPSRRTTLVQMSGRGSSPAAGSHGGTDTSSQFSEPEFTQRGFSPETINSRIATPPPTPPPTLPDPPAVRLTVTPDASPSSTRESTLDSVERSSPVASSEKKTDTGISRLSRKFNSTGRDIANASSNSIAVPQIPEVKQRSSPKKESALEKTKNRMKRFKQRRKLFSGSQDQLHRQSLETEDEGQLKETQSSTHEQMHQDHVGAQASNESSPILPSPVITEVGEGYHERRKVFFSELEQPVIPSIVTPERMSVDLSEQEPVVQQSEEDNVQSPTPDTNIDLSTDEVNSVSKHLSLVRRLRYNRKKKLRHTEEVPICPVTPTRDTNRSPSRNDPLPVPPLHPSSPDRRRLVPPDSPGVSFSLNSDTESRVSSLLGTEYISPEGVDHPLPVSPLHASSPDRRRLAPPESPGVPSSLNGDTESVISLLLEAKYVSIEGVDILHDLWSAEHGFDSAQIDDGDDDDVLTRMMMTVAGMNCTSDAMLLQQCVVEPCTSQMQNQIKAQWLRESASTRPLNDDYGPELKKISPVKKPSKRKKKSKPPTHSPRVAV
eukprot:scaffold237497_cov58-Attheya_sp.AAC.1